MLEFINIFDFQNQDRQEWETSGRHKLLIIRCMIHTEFLKNTPVTSKLVVLKVPLTDLESPQEKK